MGMYTELHLCVRMNPNLPKEVVDILHFMVGHSDEMPSIEDDGLPDHPLFRTGRWFFMLRSDSYYFAMLPNAEFQFDDIANQYYLSIRTNFKNYDDEIAKFLNWIMPYVEYRDECYGYIRYEEDKLPTLIFHKELMDVSVKISQII